ncbi:MAG: PBP1A family penicillin-binding protein, partial [Bacteroidetes bacterium]
MGFLSIGGLAIWISSLKLPDLDNFTERTINSSSKIYDTTGEVILYDVHENIQRTYVPYEKISPYIINAFIAIEDKKFYEHPGIDVKSTIRAIIQTGLKKLGIKKDGRIQGGSTITQQVIKNTLLTRERTISRKIKEWTLSLKLEKRLSKQEIMEYYLNEVPYMGSMYGVEQGAQALFSKHASDVTLAEAAYLASIPNAPAYLSPYGPNRDKLEQRKNKVLKNMLDMGFITYNEYKKAIEEEVVFKNQSDLNAKAIHFVQYVIKEAKDILNIDSIETAGLKIITTLDYDLQQKAEEIVYRNALKNEEKYNASNQSLVAVNPKDGAILTMVGSRDYNDPNIDGKFNIATAKRQPGSSFKPIVYYTLFEKGYTDKTILFDTQTQFTEKCAPDDFTKENDEDCYAPNNYDNKFKGPLTIREALAQSRNVPAVKATYIAGLNDIVNNAKKLGLTTITDPNRYGLTIVLGGGEVKLIEMTGAYATFANDGVYNKPYAIKRIEDLDGNVLYEHKVKPKQVLNPQYARMISDILKDNEARTPLFGPNSFFYFGPDIDVAGKTGTTQNNKDAWVLGYSTSIAAGVWSGNNDNTPMKKGSSISGPSWREFMDYALQKYPPSKFKKPEEIQVDKPILNGVWLGDTYYEIDTISKKLATDLTPPETRKKIIIPNIHSILYWVSKDDPRGPRPENQEQEWSLYNHFEYGVQKWVQDNNLELFQNQELINQIINKPTEYDDVHTKENQPKITVFNQKQIEETAFKPTDIITIKQNIKTKYP